MKKIRKIKNNLSKQIEAKTDLGFNLLIDQVENEEITYKTLDENIATVTDAGLVTGQKYGTTKIEVSTNKLPNKVLIDVQVLRKNDKTIAKTVSGTDFTLALKADGTVWTWGYNGYGQLGLGDNSNRYRPTQINIEKNDKTEEKEIEGITKKEIENLGEFYIDIEDDLKNDDSTKNQEDKKEENEDKK